MTETTSTCAAAIRKSYKRTSLELNRETFTPEQDLLVDFMLTKDQFIDLGKESKIKNKTFLPATKSLKVLYINKLYNL